MAKGKYAHRADTRLKVLESEALQKAHAKNIELTKELEQANANLRKELREAFRAGAVEDVAALGPVRHEARLLQHLEVLRDRALGDAAALGQIRNRDFPIVDDALEDGTACWVGEGAHDDVDR